MSLTPFELSCIDDIESGRIEFRAEDTRVQHWLRVGFWSMVQIGARIRDTRLDLSRVAETLKEDGSPATPLEQQIEDFMKETLSVHIPEAVFMGEESGASKPGPGITVAIDPIDGTWAFLSQVESCATSLAFFEDGIPRASLIMNPATGEIGYTAPGVSARQLQMPMFGSEHQAVDLPSRSGPRLAELLVNVHPSRSSSSLMQHLHRQWNDRGIRHVKSIGGSPSWAMLETAKGHYVYVNLWSRGPAQVYDLAAGVLLVRGAGGDVVDVNGAPIDPLLHTGPFVSGIDPTARVRVIEALAASLSSGRRQDV